MRECYVTVWLILAHSNSHHHINTGSSGQILLWLICTWAGSSGRVSVGLGLWRIPTQDCDVIISQWYQVTRGNQQPSDNLNPESWCTSRPRWSFHIIIGRPTFVSVLNLFWIRGCSAAAIFPPVQHLPTPFKIDLNPRQPLSGSGPGT